MIQRELVEIPGGAIPLTIEALGDEFLISVDGEQWCEARSQRHAVIIFEMLLEHLTEYMHFEKR